VWWVIFELGARIFCLFVKKRAWLVVRGGGGGGGGGGGWLDYWAHGLLFGMYVRAKKQRHPLVFMFFNFKTKFPACFQNSRVPKFIVSQL